MAFLRLAILLTLCLAASAVAAPILIVDLSVANRITITGTTEVSLATVTGSVTTGAYLENFYGVAPTTGTGTINTLVTGTPKDFTSAQNVPDNTPSLFITSNDRGLNPWSWSASASFVMGQRAFAGQATWSLTATQYNLMLGGPRSGNVYFPAENAGGVATASLIGTYSHNNAPVAVNDSITVDEDSSATVVSVLPNDSDADVGNVLTVVSVTQPATGGTVTLNGGVVRFTPNANFAGTTSFTYTISDGNGGTSTATVRVTVSSVNDPPTANDDSFVVDANSAATVLNVLANDAIAPDVGETLTVSAVTQPASGGTVTLTGGVVSFTPSSGFDGTTMFTYTVSDGNGGSATATVRVTVVIVPCNDLFFSAYLQIGDNRAFQLFNPTAAAIELGDYAIKKYANGNTATYTAATVPLSGKLAAGNERNFCYPGTNVLGIKCNTNNTAFNWDGDDTIVLVKKTAQIDIFGCLGNYPGVGGWTCESDSTVKSIGAALRRKSNVNAGYINRCPGNDFNSGICQYEYHSTVKAAFASGRVCITPT